MPAIWARRQTANVDDKVGESEVVVVLSSPKVFLGSGAALGRQVGITAIPLVGLGVFNSFDGTVIYDVSAKAIGFQIPLQAIERGINVAIRAPNLALKRIMGGE